MGVGFGPPTVGAAGGGVYPPEISPPLPDDPDEATIAWGDAVLVAVTPPAPPTIISVREDGPPPVEPPPTLMAWLPAGALAAGIPGMVGTAGLPRIGVADGITPGVLGAPAAAAVGLVSKPLSFMFNTICVPEFKMVTSSRLGSSFNNSNSVPGGPPFSPSCKLT